MATCSAEELANKVLNQIKEKYGKIKYPIDPFKLLKEEKIFVTFSDFEKLEGIILKDEAETTIVSINKNSRFTRQRFTAAHEYCHYIKDLGTTSSRIDCLKDSKARIERYADDFASHLLIPIKELKKICDKVKDKNGFVSFEMVTYISEYFGVSFKACINKIAYELHMIDGDITPKELNKRIRKYKPDSKRKELIESTNDKDFLGNIIDSLSIKMLEINSIVGARFLNKYIYNDNRLEGLSIPKNEVSYILADLYYNQENSDFLNIDNENIIMTLGNYKLQEYILTTKESVNVDYCGKMHSILYSYTAYPEYSGTYRRSDAIIRNGIKQPVTYAAISEELKKLGKKLESIIINKNNYSESQFIDAIIPIIHRFTIIHPFTDGNGRISRALLNWCLREKNIPPIYIDMKSRKEYLDALGTADKENDYTKLIVLVEKRIINTMIEMHCYPTLDYK